MSPSPPSQPPRINEVADLSGRLRAERKRRGLTLQQAADKAGLSIGFLSHVERGLTAPSLTSLVKIARVLGLDLGMLFGAPPQSTVTNVADRPRFTLAKTGPGADVVFERLSQAGAGLGLSGLLVHFPPGFATGDDFGHDGEEILFVMAGEIELEVNGDVRRLTMGDAAHYRSDQPHNIRTPPGRPGTIIWVGTMDLFGDTEALPALSLAATG